MMRKALLVALPLTGVAVAAGLGLAMASQGGNPAAAPSSSSAASSSPAAPETDAGAGRTSSSAPSATATSTTSATPSSVGQGTPVQVVLGYAGWEPTGQVEVVGFVSSAVEAGGTCTVTLSRDGRQVEATGPAEPDATTTNCGLLVVPDDQLTPGEWQATLSYRSPTSYGSSQPTAVTVPAR